MSALKIVFMGTPDFSVPAFEALADAYTVVAVYAQPPRPAGRGKKDRKNPVHVAAEARDIPVYTPLNFKDATDRERFNAHQADLAVVAAYGLILPQEILDAPRLGAINIHASLLPRWRGAAPIQRAIMTGDKETGVTIMQMVKKLDAGAMLTKETLPITADSTAGNLHDALSALGSEMIVPAVTALDAGHLTPEEQDETLVTYAAKIDKAEAAIDWTRSAEDLSRHIRGLSPFPGAFCEKDGTRLKLLNVMAEEKAHNAAPGTLLDDAGLVACGTGALRLTKLQKAGKGPMDIDVFLRGTPLPVGTKL